MLNEKKRIANGLEGKEEWAMYHKKLPMWNVPLAQNLPDKFIKKEPTPFLQEEIWETAFILLARTINETQIVGKPAIQKYFKPMTPEHLDREFDGTYKQFMFIK